MIQCKLTGENPHHLVALGVWKSQHFIMKVGMVRIGVRTNLVHVSGI